MKTSCLGGYKMSLTLQEQTKLKLTAFFFNNKADALRSEMYRSLCLLALASSEKPKTTDEIVNSIMLYLGASNPISAGLKVIVTDELAALREKGEINILHGGVYELNTDSDSDLPDLSGEKILVEKIAEEIRKVARGLNPVISKFQLEKLQQFFIEASNLIASHQMPFITRGQAVRANIMDDHELATAVSEIRIKHEIDQYIDGDKFIRKVFLNPTTELGKYLYSLYQVSVAIHLLAWEPSLQYIEKNILANLKIYLDTNIVFILMQNTNASHHFVLNLLQASAELGVRFIVHSDTIKEYEGVIEWADSQFESYQPTLREIMKMCKRDKEDPANYIEGSVYTDYFLTYPDKIDLGTWQEYLSSVSTAKLLKKLQSLGINVDNSNSFVPQPEYDNIKAAILKASKEQSERKKRQIKIDPGHDARIYYKLNSIRRKRPEGELSLGYDTYLLTFDGSLRFFLRNYDVPWTETYFIFPNQWYELSFPFFRPKFANMREFTSALTSMVFSPAFPSISALMPLDLCKYIFDLGGHDLPLGSVQDIIHAGIEKQIIEHVDPSNKDRKRKEENEVAIRRLIAQEKLKHEGIVAEIYQDAQKKLDDVVLLEKRIQDLNKEKDRLEKDIEDQLVEYDKTKNRARFTVAQQAHFEKSTQEKSEVVEKLNLQAEELKENLAQKERAIQYKETKIAELETNIDSMRTKLDEITKFQAEQENKQIEEQKKKEKERLNQEEKKTKQREQTRKVTVSIFMIVGLLIGLSILIIFGFNLPWVLLFTGLTAIGLTSYFRFGLWSFIPYGLGLIIVTGLVLDKYNLSSILWIIPMSWEITIFLLERLLRKSQ